MFPLLDATRLAKFRDWIIVAGGLSYLLGFLVVASYSTWQGLGIIKALGMISANSVSFKSV